MSIATVITDSDSQLALAVDYLFTIRSQGRGDFLTKAQAIENSAKNDGDFGPLIKALGRTALVGLGRAYQAELVRQLDPVFKNILRLAGKPAGDVSANWDFIYDFLVAQSLTFEARGPAWPTFPDDLVTSGKGGSSAIVGDSQIVQLLVDKYGFDLDAGNGDEVFYLKCVAAEGNGGTQYAETFELTSDGSLTIFQRGPRGIATPRRITIPNDGGGFLKNFDFKIGNVANASPSQLGAWLDDAGISSSRYSLVDTPTYRPSKNELGTGRTPLALDVLATGTLYQVITKTLRRDRPYLFGGAFYTRTGGDRTVQLKLGTNTGISFDQSGETPDTWDLKYATLDENLWLDNLVPVDGATKLRMELIRSGGTTDGLVVDNFFIIEGIPVNGRWLFIIPAQLAHALDDQYVWTDGAPTNNGKIATVVEEAYNKHIPTAGSPTVSDPA